MNDVFSEFTRDATKLSKFGGKLGGFLAGTLTAFIGVFLFNAFNGVINIKNNIKGGKDIEATVEGDNEKSALQQIANKYLGEIKYSDLKGKEYELTTSLENFNKDVWEKYCKEYNLNYAKVLEKDVDGKDLTKIFIYEENQNQLAHVFEAYNREMQSLEKNRITAKQLQYIDEKAKEKNIDIEALKTKIEENPFLKETMKDCLFELDKEQDKGLKFNSTLHFFIQAQNILDEEDFSHIQNEKIIEDKLKMALNQEKSRNNRIHETEKEAKEQEEIEPTSFLKAKEKILEDPKIQKEKEQQQKKEKNINHGQKAR